VVKLGGSLGGSDALRAWLDLLADAPGPPRVVVPGGGIFADAVRDAQVRWRFDDRTAHRLAILAMRQTGLLLAALAPRLRPSGTDDVAEAAAAYGTAVWLLDEGIADDPALPASWSVTSDSIALWLGARLRAERVVLVKSAKLPVGSAGAASLAAAGIVDAAFPMFAGSFAGEIVLLHRDDTTGFRALLAGTPAGCPVVVDAAAPR
jgi:aspartokinase-like uncharacterized kinase